MLQPPTRRTVECEGWVTCNWVGSLLSVFVKDSSYLASNLFCANSASCKDSSSRLLFVGTWAWSHKIAWSLVSQPTLRRKGDARLTGTSSKKGIRAKSPPTFIWGKRQKNQKRRGLRTLSVKGSGVVFTHGEGISTLHAHHKGRHPLIKCANMTSNYFIFLFLHFYVFLHLFIFLSFCDWQGCCPCSYVFLNCDKEIRPT